MIITRADYRRLETLRDIQASEINFEISCFWNSGWRWKLGDVLNGFLDEGEGITVEEAVEGLAESAIKHFPNSRFAKFMLTGY